MEDGYTEIGRPKKDGSWKFDWIFNFSMTVDRVITGEEYVGYMVKLIQALDGQACTFFLKSEYTLHPEKFQMALSEASSKQGMQPLSINVSKQELRNFMSEQHLQFFRYHDATKGPAKLYATTKLG